MSSFDQAGGVKPPASAVAHHYSPATKGIHADNHLNSASDVAPSLHTSTTFRYEADPQKLKPISDWEIFKHADRTPTDSHVYSRLSAPNTTRLEALLSSLIGGRAITYTSGLAAFHALLVHLNPRRVAIGAGYHGCHGVLAIYQKLTGCSKIDLHGSDAEWDAAGLGKGDVVHVETPLNPTGEAYNLSAFAERAHARGAYLTVDATFAPPPLQDPFAHGADVIMHSGTKYIGGHSDMLCGVLAVKRDDWWWELYHERLHLGAVMGSLEGWLGLRSMRTLELRVQRQSANATELVRRLHLAMGGNTGGEYQSANGAISGSESSRKNSDVQTVRATVQSITHASLQAQNDTSTAKWLTKQMPSGYGPVFAMSLKTPQMAKRLPSQLALFHHATSLGGVESLIEWRRMSDQGVDERLLRVSVGIESVEDLWADIVKGLRGVLELESGRGSSVGSKL